MRQTHTELRLFTQTQRRIKLGLFKKFGNQLFRRWRLWSFVHDAQLAARQTLHAVHDARNVRSRSVGGARFVQAARRHDVLLSLSMAQENLNGRKLQPPCACAVYKCCIWMAGRCEAGAQYVEEADMAFGFNTFVVFRLIN